MCSSVYTPSPPLSTYTRGAEPLQGIHSLLPSLYTCPSSAFLKPRSLWDEGRKELHWPPSGFPAARPSPPEALTGLEGCAPSSSGRLRHFQSRPGRLPGEARPDRPTQGGSDTLVRPFTFPVVSLPFSSQFLGLLSFPSSAFLLSTSFPGTRAHEAGDVRCRAHRGPPSAGTRAGVPPRTQLSCPRALPHHAA